MDMEAYLALATAQRHRKVYYEDCLEWFLEEMFLFPLPFAVLSTLPWQLLNQITL